MTGSLRAVSGAGTPGPSPAGHRRPRAAAVAGAVLAAVALAALGVQAARGTAVVSGQSSPSVERQARLDDAFYACLDTQARSLVAPGRTVALGAGDLADVVTLLKAVGSWVTVADPPASADVTLTLRSGPAAPGTCLGTVVVGRVKEPSGRVTVRVGTGAAVPGQGPPPAPPV